jgi:hypothetical protein
MSFKTPAKAQNSCGFGRFIVCAHDERCTRILVQVRDPRRAARCSAIKTHSEPAEKKFCRHASNACF